MAEISAVGASNAAWANAVGNDGAAPVNEVSTEAAKAATANAVTEAVGTAVNDAAQQLQQQNGMPKFLVEDIKRIVDTAVQGLTSQPQGIHRCAPTPLQNFTASLTQQIVDAVNNSTQQQTGAAKKGGGSWMQAIAEAMGKVMGEKAATMVKLSGEIQALTQKTTAAGANGQQVTDDEKMKNASDTQVLNAKFQATGQEFNLLQTTFSTAIKTIGEGMSSVARKQ